MQNTDSSIMKVKYRNFKQRVLDTIEVGYIEDYIGRAYDVINLCAIVINLMVSVALTFDSAVAKWGNLLTTIEAITVAFFTIDYLLRVWTSEQLYPEDNKWRALLRYIFSFNGLVDLLSSLPYYLPFFFPTGVAAFRIFRVIRIFRIFRLNAYSDSLNLIVSVIADKARLLFSSVFVIVMLMLAASLTMYSIEHNAQPEVFDNALSGLWWSAATLLTVGYGDIYPITAAGKILGIVITMLGVGLVAIPTGIISAGFVEQYEKIKALGEKGEEEDIRFIKTELKDGDKWVGRSIAELDTPLGILIAVILRDGDVLIPRGDVRLKTGDQLIIGAESGIEDFRTHLKEIRLKEQNEWNGQKIRDLDISRQTFIVMVKRNGKGMLPYGDMILREGDLVIMYTREHLRNAKEFQEKV